MSTLMSRGLARWEFPMEPAERARFDAFLAESAAKAAAAIRANIARIESGIGEGTADYFDRAKGHELARLRKELAIWQRVAARAASAATPVLEAAE